MVRLAGTFGSVNGRVGPASEAMGEDPGAKWFCSLIVFCPTSACFPSRTRYSRRLRRPDLVSWLSVGSHWIPNVRPLCSVADKDVKIRVAAGTDPKHRTVIATVRPSVLRRLIEIAVAALHEPGIWVHSICRVAGKHVKNRFRLCVGL